MSSNTNDCNCADCQAMKRAQTNAALSKKTTQCDCNDCQTLRRKQLNGMLKPRLTGSVAHAIAQKLADGTINAWELPLTPKQRQKGAPPLVYLAGLTFIASFHNNKPPFRKGQLDFFMELQKLYNTKRKKPLDNPTLYELSELFVPCQKAQDIIDVQVMAHQRQLDDKNIKSESLHTAHVSNTLQKKRGRKKSGTKKRKSIPNKPNSHTTTNTKEEASSEETNNEWLEKLQKVLLTQNENGNDVVVENPAPLRKVKTAVCTVLHEDQQEEEQQQVVAKNTPGGTLGAMNVDQVMSLMAREEVALSLLNKDDDEIPNVPILPSFDESKDEEEENENDDKEEATIVEKEKKKVTSENGTNGGSTTKEKPVNLQDESVNGGDSGIQKESIVAAAVQPNAEPTQPQEQHDVSERVERLQDQLKKIQSKLEEQDFMLEVQTEMLAEKEAALKTQESTIEKIKTLLKKEQEANQQLQSKLTKSQERNRAFEETFQKFTSQVSKI